MAMRMAMRLARWMAMWLDTVLGGRVLDRNKLFSLEWEELGELVVSPVLTLWSLF